MTRKSSSSRVSMERLPFVDEAAGAGKSEWREAAIGAVESGGITGRVRALRGDVVDALDIGQLHPPPGQAQLKVDGDVVALEVEQDHQGFARALVGAAPPADHPAATAVAVVEPGSEHPRELARPGRVEAPQA